MSTDSSAFLRAVRKVLVRDLKSVSDQIAAYPDDASVWLAPPGISNSAGTLVLHLAGNLRHFIGGALGRSGYVRDRDAEFAARDVPREKLRAEIAVTIQEVTAALDGMDTDMIDSEYPIPVGAERFKVGTADWLVHMCAHLAYHLGQIDYHRRLLTPNPAAVGNVSLAPLATE